jgi:hypothetical protein
MIFQKYLITKQLLVPILDATKNDENNDLTNLIVDNHYILKISPKKVELKLYRLLC